MKTERAQAAIEAILFASGEPVTVSRISEVLETEFDDAVRLTEGLAAEFEKRKSGIKIVRLGNSFQMCTNSEYAEEIKKTLNMKRNAPLSQAAFEVLAVIAYNQPVTKSFIEQVRGVDCSGVVNTLVEKELVEERGRLDAPGRPLLYGTTQNFLRCFGLESLFELPAIDRNEILQIPEQEEMLVTQMLEAEQ